MFVGGFWTFLVRFVVFYGFAVVCFNGILDGLSGFLVGVLLCFLGFSCFLWGLVGIGLKWFFGVFLLVTVSRVCVVAVGFCRLF